MAQTPLNNEELGIRNFHPSPLTRYAVCGWAANPKFEIPNPKFRGGWAAFLIPHS